MLYRILLFSVKPQHESAIGIHISPPFWNSLPIQFLSEKSACEWVPEETPKRPQYLQRRLRAAHSVPSLRGSSHALFANHIRPNVAWTLHVLVGFALFSASQIGAAGLDKNTVTKSCPGLCKPMGCSTPGFPALHYHLELAQTHIHWVGDAI